MNDFPSLKLPMLPPVNEEPVLSPWSPQEEIKGQDNNEQKQAELDEIEVESEELSFPSSPE